jgi:uncharacterized membrane protein YccF (DUF307 family)
MAPMFSKTNFAIKIRRPVAATLAFVSGGLYAAPTEQQCVRYKVEFVEQSASFVSFSEIFPKIWLLHFSLWLCLGLHKVLVGLQGWYAIGYVIYLSSCV